MEENDTFFFLKKKEALAASGNWIMQPLRKRTAESATPAYAKKQRYKNT